MQPNSNATNGPVALTMDRGISVGDNDDVDTIISVLVSNSTVQEEEAVQF